MVRLTMASATPMTATPVAAAAGMSAAAMFPAKMCGGAAFVAAMAVAVDVPATIIAATEEKEIIVGPASVVARAIAAIVAAGASAQR
jgi:hypothetical protein